MNPIASLLMLIGSFLAVLAGAGLLRLSTPYARIHAAGKASPVAFMIAALGAAIEIGLSGAAYLVIAAAAMVLTLPVGVHLLFRAAHASGTGHQFVVDDLATAKQATGTVTRPTTDEPNSTDEAEDTQ